MHNSQLDGDRFYASRFMYNKQRDLLGEGTYGKVYRAFDTVAKSRVALKLVTFDPMVEGCPLLVLRELGTIRKVLGNAGEGDGAHRHIVSLRDIIYESGGNSVGISFELCECDLRQYLARHGAVTTDSRRLEYSWSDGLHYSTQQLRGGILAVAVDDPEWRPQFLEVELYCCIRIPKSEEDHSEPFVSLNQPSRNWKALTDMAFYDSEGGSLDVASTHRW
ncbi:hypothetical protein FOZ60_007897, partial [Perkinsus olseni]